MVTVDGVYYTGGSQPLGDTSGNIYCSLGTIVIDPNGQLFSPAGILVDTRGNIYNAGGEVAIAVNGALSGQTLTTNVISMPNGTLNVQDPSNQISFFGNTPSSQISLDAGPAGTVYGPTEQSMLNELVAALSAYGLLG